MSISFYDAQCSSIRLIVPSDPIPKAEFLPIVGRHQFKLPRSSRARPFVPFSWLTWFKPPIITAEKYKFVSMHGNHCRICLLMRKRAVESASILRSLSLTIALRTYFVISIALPETLCLYSALHVPMSIQMLANAT